MRHRGDQHQQQQQQQQQQQGSNAGGHYAAFQVSQIRRIIDGKTEKLTLCSTFVITAAFGVVQEMFSMKLLVQGSRV